MTKQTCGWLSRAVAPALLLIAAAGLGACTDDLIGEAAQEILEECEGDDCDEIKPLRPILETPEAGCVARTCCTGEGDTLDTCPSDY